MESSPATNNCLFFSYLLGVHLNTLCLVC
jgi:hypothetical protein